VLYNLWSIFVDILLFSSHTNFVKKIFFNLQVRKMWFRDYNCLGYHPSTARVSPRLSNHFSLFHIWFLFNKNYLPLSISTNYLPIKHVIIIIFLLMALILSICFVRFICISPWASILRLSLSTEDKINTLIV
jgi:hypothetical protein